jgi:hypothetical protein
MSTKLTKILLSILLTGCFTAAHADSVRERAMHNAERLSVTLGQVIPSYVQSTIAEIASGKVKRYAPEEPVWIMEMDQGTILYYQGQDGFTGQPADKLVDDNGQRFGQLALTKAKSSTSSWLTLKLGGQSYPAFCVSHDPLVICSLAVAYKG